MLSKSDMLKQFRVVLAFLVSAIVFFIFEVLLTTIDISRVFNGIENILFAIIIVAISFLFNSEKVKRYYFIFTIVIYNICLFFETFYYYHFKGIFSNSALFVVLESNEAETKEFLTSYFNPTIGLLLCLTVLLIIFGLKALDKTINSISYFKPKKIKVLLFCSVILIFLKLTELIVYNVPYLIVKTPLSYYIEMKKLAVYGKKNPLGHFTNVERTISPDKKELYVIVIGESTSRLHFNLTNEYYRETTPLLKSFKEQLIVFSDVISPHAYTIGALSKGLTLGNFENPKGKYQGSIIQLLNQADFKTYWISNQRPVGISDTHVTKIARGADVSIFLNLKHTSEQTPYDEVLLETLDKVLLEEGNKKVIFLHMIGAHFYYEMRYPEKFNHFKNVPKTKFKKEEAYNTINAYDNVMKYTDSILSEVIKTVTKQPSNSFVLYFSDHGQEVYDDIDFFGQTIDQLVTKNMYDIPMFLWMNDSYKQTKRIANNSDKKYMTDDIMHSIADLCGVNSSEIDSTRSIFSNAFIERKRIIKDSLDYDTYF
jgi:heptose-I-phosphate ethanolaminephosphotransferase